MHQRQKPHKRKYLECRLLQAQSAICLVLWSDAKGIDHPSLHELIEHLLLVLVATDVGEWEKIGARLPLSGWDLSAPQSLRDSLSAPLFDELMELVVAAVEVGLEMGCTVRPEAIQELEKCEEILRASGVEPPPESFYKWLKRRGETWGPPLSEKQFGEFLQTVDELRFGAKAK